MKANGEASPVAPVKSNWAESTLPGVMLSETSVSLPVLAKAEDKPDDCKP